MKRLILISASSLVLFGCQSFRVRGPGPIIEPPMVVGKAWKFGAEAGYRSAQGVEITSNAGARPPDFTAPRQVDEGDTYMGLSMGLARRMDVKLDLGLNGMTEFAAKFQFLGDPLLEEKEGNVVASVMCTAGSGSGSAKGDQAYEFGPGGFPWSASASLSTTILSAMAGYQTSERMTLYGGYSQATYRASYSISQEASRDNTSPAAEYKGTGKGSASAIGAGFEYGNTGYFGALIQYEMRKWDGTADKKGFQLGLNGRVPF